MAREEEKDQNPKRTGGRDTRTDSQNDAHSAKQDDKRREGRDEESRKETRTDSQGSKGKNSRGTNE